MYAGLDDLGKVEFQSTLPMRGETEKLGEQDLSSYISIHSPHAGRDVNGSLI